MPDLSPRDDGTCRQFVCAHAVSFTTADRVVWSVQQVVADHAPGARWAPCLVFASLEAMRRVWIFPEDWAACSSAELLELSWGR